MSEKNIDDIIKRIQGEDAFWKIESKEKYTDACKLLIALNMSDDDIAELLSGLYWAAAAEFGG